jgi:hypothetical protein
VGTTLPPWPCSLRPPNDGHNPPERDRETSVPIQINNLPPASPDKTYSSLRNAVSRTKVRAGSPPNPIRSPHYSLRPPDDGRNPPERDKETSVLAPIQINNPPPSSPDKTYSSLQTMGQTTLPSWPQRGPIRLIMTSRRRRDPPFQLPPFLSTPS